MLIHIIRQTIPLIVFVLGLGGNAMAAERLWVYNTTGGALEGSPSIGDVDRDGSPDIVVTSTSGVVFAVDAFGHEIWSTDLGDMITNSSTLADVLGGPGLEVLVMTLTGRIVCLEGLTGDILWDIHPLGEIHWGGMTVVAADLDRDGRIEIVVGDKEGKLVCLTGTGETRWTYDGTEGIRGAPAVDDLDGDGIAEIVFVTTDTPLVCLRADGTEFWRMTETTSTWGNRLRREATGPVIWDLDGDDQPEILVGIGYSLAAVDSLGNLLWDYPMANQVDSAISVADADGDGELEIYTADLTGKIAALTPKGEEIWTAKIATRARRSPAIADVDGDGEVEILFGGYTGFLHVFDTKGNEKERLVVNGNTNATTSVVDLLGDGGLCAVIPEISGDLVVYRWEPVREDPLILWPVYRGNEARTGSEFPATSNTIATRITGVDFGNCYADSAVFRLDIANPERKALTIRMEIQSGDTSVAQVVRRSRKKRLAVKIPYKPTNFHDSRASFSYDVSDGDEVLDSRTVTMNLVPFATQLDELRASLDELSGLLSALPDADGVTERLSHLLAQTRQLEAGVERVAELSPMERRNLRDRLALASGDSSRLLTIAKQAVEEGRVLVVYAANPWAPFGGMDEIIEGRMPAASLEGSGAGNTHRVEAFYGEIESAAFNVFNFGGRTLTLRVLAGDLIAEGDGATTPAKDVLTLREVVDVPTQRADMSADALPTLGQGYTLMVPPWESRQLWVTIDTKGLTPGTWSGTVRLRSLDVAPHEASADLVVNVWDAAIPEKQPLKLCHWSPSDLIEGSLEDQVAHGTSIFFGRVPPKASFDEKGNLTGPIDYAEHDAYMLRHAPHGIILMGQLVSLSGPAPAFSPVWQKAYNQSVRAWIRHLKKLGFGYDSFAFYPVDEPGVHEGKLVEVLLKWAEAARQADPHIRMFANPGANLSLETYARMGEYIDLWSMGYLPKFPTELLDYMHSVGEECWHYTCSHDAKHLSPLGYYRGQAWLVWHFGHTGIGFWTYFNAGSDPWFMPASGADYEMVYQGDGVVVSKRWEAVRDGIEDYGMLDMLRKAADAAEAEGRQPDMVAEARRVCGDQAKAIARFCDWDEDGTVPGKDGLPGVRIIADKRWRLIQETRREMARLLASLRQEP
ncbi:MAG: PQQ-binding-like beta-propeller repeat protein [Nitrospiraceae bacterium]|nr:PQQ-binding-like beta-propeller repeat protein [Nitrospiraceae bacterium]